MVAENGREYLVRRHEGNICFEIGREQRDLTDPCYFSLASTTTLSKRHAQIFWDIDKQRFFVKNLSKNKIYVEEDEVLLDSAPKELQHMQCVMIAKIRFYFLLPL